MGKQMKQEEKLRYLLEGVLDESGKLVLDELITLLKEGKEVE